MPKLENMPFFRSYEPLVAMCCFYDMNQKDAAQLMGVHTGALLDYRKKFNFGPWPFMTMKQGACSPDAWTEIAKHREEVARQAQPQFIEMLAKAARLGRLNRSIFDPVMQKQRAEQRLRDLAASPVHSVYIQPAKGRKVVQPKPAPTPDQAVRVPLPAQAPYAKPPRAPVQVQPAVPVQVKLHMPAVQAKPAQEASKGLPTIEDMLESYENEGCLQNTCLSHIVEELPLGIDSIGIEQWDSLFLMPLE